MWLRIRLLFACAVLLARCVQAVPQGTSVNVDIVLTLDNSGSMRKNDPNRLMPLSVEELTSRLPDRCRVAIVIFDQQPVVALSLTPKTAPDFPGQVRSALRQVDYRGKFTDIPGAIERALYELRAGREAAQRLILLFTDGVVDTGDAAKDAQRTQWLQTTLVAQAQDQKIQIAGVAFTEQADFQLIQSLAQATGADYFRVLTANDIQPAFDRVAAMIAAGPHIPPSPKASTPTQLTGPTVGEPSGLPGLWVVIVIMSAGLAAGVALYVRWRSRRLSVRASLVSLEDSSETYTLNRTKTYVGRDPKCDIQLKHDSVGRRHALIAFRDGGFCIHDLRSRNGTFLNSTRLGEGSTPPELPLRSGDVVRFHSWGFIFAAAGGTVGSTILVQPTPQLPCPNHPEQAATVACRSCRDLFCGLCVRKESGLCPACSRKARSAASSQRPREL